MLCKTTALGFKIRRTKVLRDWKDIAATTSCELGGPSDLRDAGTLREILTQGPKGSGHLDVSV